MKPSSLILSFICLSLSAKVFAASVPNEFVIKLKAPIGSQGAVKALNKTADFSPTVISQKGKLVLVKAASAEQVLSTLDNSEIEYIEPNYIYELTSLPNDPRLKNEWGIKSKKGNDINVLPVWEQLTGSPDVIVAVSDTGINSKHQDLQENMWVNQAEKNGQPGVDDDGNGFIDDINGFHFAYPNDSGADKNGHGTHCAGVIGASGNNSIGVVGVNWKANLMNSGFLSGSGSGSLANAIRSVDYAVQMGARVISASWGSTEKSIALGEAIDRAGRAGVVFVAAAGNAGKNNDRSPFFPANYDLPNVISVAAMGSSGVKASFSNFGAKRVHIAAPGVNILSTYGKGYSHLDGTSMATPFVSGVVALMLQKNPALSPAEIKERIIRTAKPLATFKGKSVSGGMINAEAAVFAQ